MRTVLRVAAKVASRSKSRVSKQRSQTRLVNIVNHSILPNHTTAYRALLTTCPALNGTRL